MPIELIGVVSIGRRREEIEKIKEMENTTSRWGILTIGNVKSIRKYSSEEEGRTEYRKPCSFDELLDCSIIKEIDELNVDGIWAEANNVNSPVVRVE